MLWKSFWIPWLSVLSLLGAVYKVPVRLPQQPILPIHADETLLIAPLVIVELSEDKPKSQDLDVQQELMTYFAKTLKQRAPFKIVEGQDIQLPTTNLEKLAQSAGFWRKAALRYQADYILSGSVDFRIEDRTGYETQEVMGPYGRVYYKQVLVEKTGFTMEMVLMIFNDQGNKIKEIYLHDFKEHDVANYDPLQGFFENVHTLEDKILSLFITHKAKQRRYIFGF